MKQVLTEEQFAAFIGIDWADAKHDLCLQAGGCDKHESSTLEHTPEAIEVAWRTVHRVSVNRVRTLHRCRLIPAIASAKRQQQRQQQRQQHRSRGWNFLVTSHGWSA